MTSEREHRDMIGLRVVLGDLDEVTRALIHECEPEVAQEMRRRLDRAMTAVDARAFRRATGHLMQLRNLAPMCRGARDDGEREGPATNRPGGTR